MSPLVECLGWTLVHFVWQGVVVALLLAVAFRLLRHAPANQRYLAGCIALALLVLAPLVTSYWVAQRAQSAPIVFVDPAPVVAPSTVSTPQSASLGTKLVFFAKPIPVREEITRQLNSVLPWLVTGWLAGVLALSCRLLAGWLRIRRWRNGAIEAVAEHWRERLSELARRLSISRPVRLVQSALVEVPTVIGWLRPVILLPASCVTGLSSSQLESILAHELAHIYRHDYLVNLLQSAVETLLFYHPAVWWVSRRIREERENCCDDIAVKICGDPVVYVRALATLEELRSAPAQLALAAGGGSLLQRIQRLLGKSGSTTGPAAWPLAGAIVVVALMAVAIGLRETRALASEPPKPETFITHFGNYHFTNNGVAAELTVATIKVFLSARKGTSLTTAGEGTWTPGPHWFVYVGKDWHVWAHDGLQGLWLIAADSVSSKMRSLEYLDEIPPDAVLKRLPKELKRTALTSAALNSAGRQQLEKMIRDAEAGRHANAKSSDRASEVRLAATVQECKLLFEAGKLNEAEEKLFVVCREDPSNPEARHYLELIKQIRLATAYQVNILASDENALKKMHPEAFSTENSTVTGSSAGMNDRLVGGNSQMTNSLDSRPTKPTPQPLETRTYHLDTGKFLEALESAGFSPHRMETNSQSRQTTEPRISGGDSNQGLRAAVREYFKSLGIDLGTNTSSADKAVFFNDRKGILFVRATGRELDVVTSALEKLNNEETLLTTNVNTRPVQNGRMESQNVVLSNGNSTVMLNRTGAAAGMNNWTVDSNNQINSQRFYYGTRNSSNRSSAYASAPSPIQTGNVVAGANATFTVAATGTAPLSYQWVFDGTNIAGATHEKPQINIKVKFVEISAPEVVATNSRAADFRWFMADNWASAAPNQTTQPPKFVSPYTIKDNKSTAASRLTVTNSIISQSTAIMNDPQSVRIVMQALEQRDGVDILTTPEITTRDNSHAQMQMLDLMTVVVGMSKAATGEKSSPHPLTETLGFGPIFDVLPKVSDDGLSIKMKMTASVTGFKGYATAKPPTPQIDGRRIEAEATVLDGQTVLLYGRGPQTTVVVKDKVPVLGSIPLLGRLFQSKSTSTVRKDLLVFVTPTLINPDGTPYHSKRDSSGQSPSAPPSASRDEAKKTN